MPVSMLGDFLAYTLAGTRPSPSEAHGVCANGACAGRGSTTACCSWSPRAARHAVHATACWSRPACTATKPRRSNCCRFWSRDIAQGAAALKCRLLVILGNVDAMRDACRYRDDDLNRLFSGRHLQVPASHEAPRAAALEQAAHAVLRGGVG